ncbi:MAG: LysR family transcriptional regulator, partial [Candidatus Adiutricales bacterium]
MILDSQKLHVFLVVAKEKSFSKAGEILFRTQPAVSQSIRALEDELGERLFLREGRTNSLTQAGRILKEHAEEAFAA